MKKEYTIGYFLEIRHIENSFKLLKKQIEQTSPLYNTLDFKIYREEDKIKTFNAKSFFNKYIKNDTFYYFQNIFYVTEYLGVQSAYKNRKYQFLSFDALILYNAIGLYIQEVLNHYETDFTELLKQANGQVFYGGKLNYKEAEKSTIFYYEDYQKFLNAKEILTKPNTGKTKYILTVDIQSYFYTINHKRLLSIIEKNATNVTKKRFHYDENTIASIDFLLKFLLKSNYGIPVSSQNIVSSYLSSIFFSPFDQYIMDNYLKNDNISYIRYVDDFYIIYEVDNSKPKDEIRNDLYNIENDISDFLSNELGLTVSSSKSKRSEISDNDSYFDFLTISHTTSPNEIEYVEVPIKDLVQDENIKGKDVPTIFKECIGIIKDTKNQLLGFQKIEIEKQKSNFLNNILINKGVLNYSKSKKGLKLIEKEKILLTYNSFDYLLTKLKVLLHLLTIEINSRNYFHDLMKTECKSIKNINQKLMLIERFILQLEFVSFKDLKEKILKKSDIKKFKKDYRAILKRFVKEKPNNLYAGLVYKIFNNQFLLNDFIPIYTLTFLNKNENSSLMQQLKQRHLNERLGFFNVAFNHLLNEFQNLVEIAYFNRKEQNALKIINKLSKKGFKIEEVLFVSDFFKRRNQNSISHTNYPELGFWGVSEKEYYTYKTKIMPLIKKIKKDIK